MEQCSLTDMAGKKCVPCEGGVPALSRAEADAHLKVLPGWTLAPDAKSITVSYVMKDFVSAVARIGQIAEVAEREGHHPDIHLTGYKNLRIDLSTHAIGGLSENDFILAAKIAKLAKH